MVCLGTQALHAKIQSIETWLCMNLCPAMCADCILEAWQHGDDAQRSKLLDQLVRVLQSVSEEEAQALPDKDPEVPGMYDKLCRMLVRRRLKEGFWLDAS